MSTGGVSSSFRSSWPERHARLDWQQPIQSFADLRARIDAYDKSTGDLFVESTLPWMARNVAAEVGHQYYNLPKNNAVFQALPPTMAGWVDSKISYNKIFNIGNAFVEKPDGVSWLDVFKDKDARQIIKQTAWGNFKDFEFSPISPKGYFKHVIMQYNLGVVAEDIRNGRILPAAAKTLGLGTLLYSVASGTRQAFQEAQQKEDGTLKSRLRTLGQTALAFVKETTQSVVAWELGTIGYMLGAGVMAFGLIPRILSGVILGGLFETGFKKMINGWEKNPQQPEALSPKTWSFRPEPFLQEVLPNALDYRA